MPTTVPLLQSSPSLFPPTNRDSSAPRTTCDFDDVLNDANAQANQAPPPPQPDPASKSDAASSSKKSNKSSKKTKAKKSDGDSEVSQADTDAAAESEESTKDAADKDASKTPDAAATKVHVDDKSLPTLAALPLQSDTFTLINPPKTVAPRTKTPTDTAAATPKTTTTADPLHPTPASQQAQLTDPADPAKPKQRLADALGDQTDSRDTPASTPNASSAQSHSQTSSNPDQSNTADPNSLAFLASFVTQTDPSDAKPASPGDPLDPFAAALNTAAANPSTPKTTAPPPSATQNTPLTDAQFADQNHLKIINDVKTQLLPHGGSMRIQLDPPELGALQVKIEIRDGVVTASFETSNDNATRLLGHSLDQLRQSLESQGVNVDKLEVRQSPKQDQPGNNPQEQHQQNAPGDTADARQEQQRRELLNRMWRRLSTGDPLDLVA